MSLFVAGKSGNPSGKPKFSGRTVRGMVERFVKRNITPTKMQRLFSQLGAKDQMEMLMQLLPYSLSKQPTEGISTEEVDRLYNMFQEAIKGKDESKTA